VTDVKVILYRFDPLFAGYAVAALAVMLAYALGVEPGGWWLLAAFTGFILGMSLRALCVHLVRDRVE
jgi:hypothetical protein